MNPPTKTRFQFTLRDMFLVIGLSVFGVFCLSPHIIKMLGYEQPLCPKTTVSAAIQLKCSLPIIAVTFAASFIALWLTKSRKGWFRVAAVLSFTPLCWLGFILVIESLFISRMTRGPLAAVAACLAYAEAQQIYRRTDYNGDGILEYAQTLHELYETKPGAKDIGLIDRGFVNAEGLPGKATPKAGYVFKILKAQGAAENGGQKSFLVKGADGKFRMTGGYALLASPNVYGVTGTGCLSFIINNQGTVYEQDLGPETPKSFEEMTEYNPGQGWTVTE